MYINMVKTAPRECFGEVPPRGCKTGGKNEWSSEVNTKSVFRGLRQTNGEDITRK